MNWENITAQFPILAVAGGVALFLYSEISKLQKELMTLTKESITAVTSNTAVLNELKGLIQKITNK